MRALTIWPEWAFAICRLGKRCENRTWRPGSDLRPGDRLAIHAGKNFGGRPGKAAAAEAVDDVRSMTQRVVARGDTHPPATVRDLLSAPTGAVVAVATIAGFDREERTGWDVPGAWHWRFGAVEVLPRPIRASGAQGLWRLPDDIEDSVYRLLSEHPATAPTIGAETPWWRAT